MTNNTFETKGQIGFPNANVVHVRIGLDEYHLFANRHGKVIWDMNRISFSKIEIQQGLIEWPLERHTNDLFTDDEVLLIRNKFTLIDVHPIQQYPISIPRDSCYSAQLHRKCQDDLIRSSLAQNFMPISAWCYFICNDDRPRSAKQLRNEGDGSNNRICEHGGGMPDSFSMYIGEVLPDADIRAYREPFDVFAFGYEMMVGCTFDNPTLLNFK